MANVVSHKLWKDARYIYIIYIYNQKNLEHFLIHSSTSLVLIVSYFLCC